MYKPCKQMFDTAAEKARKGEPRLSRILLDRLTNCGNADCPFQAECKNFTCLLEEANQAA